MIPVTKLTGLRSTLSTCFGWIPPTQQTRLLPPPAPSEELALLALVFPPKLKLSHLTPKSSTPTSASDQLAALAAALAATPLPALRPLDSLRPALEAPPPRPRRTMANVVELAGPDLQDALPATLAKF